MPTYNYFCGQCDMNHIELRSYEDRETKSTCPECGRGGCPRTWDNSKTPEDQKGSGVQIKGGTPKFYHKVGVGNKGHEEAWMQQEIDNTKEVLKDAGKGASPYSPHAVPYEELEKAGVMKKVDKNTAKLRKKASENMAKRAVENLSEKDYEYMGKNKKT
jgi:putative FmdB family regulatory protein